MLMLLRLQNAILNKNQLVEKNRKVEDFLTYHVPTSRDMDLCDVGLDTNRNGAALQESECDAVKLHKFSIF